MGKQGKNNKWQEEEIKKALQTAAEEEKIPESLKPEQMEKWLQKEVLKRENNADKNKEYDKTDKMEKTGRKYRRWWVGTAATAACLAVLVFAVGRNADWNHMDLLTKDSSAVKDEAKTTASITKKGTTYQDLYQSFSETWERQSAVAVDDMAMEAADEREMKAEEINTSEAAAAGSEMETTDTAYDASGAVDMKGDADAGTVVEDTADMAADESAAAEGAGNADYGKTNQQEADVEEADIIKNDGRYLYQTILNDNYDGTFAVQIADTEGGLKEVARVVGFESIDDIYVWNDTLVILETGWTKGGVAKMEQSSAEEDVETADVVYSNNAYSRIHIYDIKDRTNPQEYHTFTLRGEYKDSRISDGYLYFFSRYYTEKPQKEDDYEAYIPVVNDRPMREDSIYLPEDADATSYLVMASVNMQQPDSFTDNCAIVTNADRFYVSRNNIYVADSKNIDYLSEGQHTDSTQIYRFSYQNGKMQKEAEGSVKGTVRDDMAINEYKGHLRIVTTAESQVVRKVTDDITGEEIGYDGSDLKTTNNLYVLDSDLKVKGKIEDLAEGERVYAARFMGDTGYFVTFRETDPLFSVDLSNPGQPKILGELKISGFSEYLHFYADGLLLGIGMEADEDTGATKGMKLSMFDISNPMDVQEKSKLDLSKYDYAEALYDYKSVLIDTDKNLFGFYAEGYHYEDEQDYQEYRSYLLFTYENGEFRQLMDIDCSDYEKYGSYRIRGTYIGDSFYLMCINGRIEEYSLADGSKIGELEQ